MQAQIMAILNVTPDSFFAPSRIGGASQLLEAARHAESEGAAILDIGGCSTRPDSRPVSAKEEWQRIAPALEVLRKEMPQTQLSLDTFRPEIARRALSEFGTMIINDVSGGCKEMYDVVRDAGVPYVWTLRGEYSRLQEADKLEGISLILDPGLGFAGGVENDYCTLRGMDKLKEYGYPVLVGASRKSMLYKLLGTTPEDSLAATQVVHFYALQHGASILRVHDVREARQTITLYEKIKGVLPEAD